MPTIKLKKELKRTFGEWEKVFPEGKEMSVSSDYYHELLEKEYCDKIKVEKTKDVKLKKETKKKTSKE